MAAIARFYILLYISTIIAIKHFISCANPHFHGQCFIFNCFRNSNMEAIAHFFVASYIKGIYA